MSQPSVPSHPGRYRPATHASVGLSRGQRQARGRLKFLCAPTITQVAEVALAVVQVPWRLGLVGVVIPRDVGQAPGLHGRTIGLARLWDRLLLPTLVIGQARRSWGEAVGFAGVSLRNLWLFERASGLLAEREAAVWAPKCLSLRQIPSAHLTDAGILPPLTIAAQTFLLSSKATIGTKFWTRVANAFRCPRSHRPLFDGTDAQAYQKVSKPKIDCSRKDGLRQVQAAG